MLSIAAEKSNFAEAKSSPWVETFASNVPKEPLTLEIIMWRTLKATSLCIESTFQFVSILIFFSWYKFKAQ